LGSEGKASDLPLRQTLWGMEKRVQWLGEVGGGDCSRALENVKMLGDECEKGVAAKDEGSKNHAETLREGQIKGEERTEGPRLDDSHSGREHQKRPLIPTGVRVTTNGVKKRKRESGSILCLNVEGGREKVCCFKRDRWAGVRIVTGVKDTQRKGFLNEVVETRKKEIKKKTILRGTRGRPGMREEGDTSGSISGGGKKGRAKKRLI